jgi:zinc/manganese transport system substrate-binding protein
MYLFKPLLLLFLLVPVIGQAALDVVATTSSTGMLVREIAGDQAKLEILAPPDRDVHFVQARPSMIRALRSADLVVALGADLEVGWLPIAIRQAANPKILPGRPGYFEAAAQVELLDSGGPADRALGDVHPVGNPHVNMDPVRMAQVGIALAERFGELDPSNAAEYQARARAFEARVREHLPKWQIQAAQAPGAVLFHKDAVYLLDRFEVPLLGLVEPVPGVPPSGAHLKQLTDSLADRKGVILFTTYQPDQAPEALAEKLGWPTVRLALEPPLNADGEAYLRHIDRWVDALVQAQ